MLEEGVFLSNGVNIGASLVAKKYAYIGMGATIMTGVKTLGEDCLVGAGAVVIRDVPAYAVVAGVPAKVLKFKITPPQFGNEVIFPGLLGCGDVRVSARERGEPFPTLARGVRNVSRLRRFLPSCIFACGKNPNAETWTSPPPKPLRQEKKSVFLRVDPWAKSVSAGTERRLAA